jgi:hypothetical protein
MEGTTSQGLAIDLDVANDGTFVFHFTFHWTCGPTVDGNFSGQYPVTGGAFKLHVMGSTDTSITGTLSSGGAQGTLTGHVDSSDCSTGDISWSASSTGAGTDSDDDGCTDAQEDGLSPQAGGMRDPDNFWDFFDVPTGSPLHRDHAITVGDVGGVVGRFGSNDATPSTFDRDSDPLTTPNAAVVPSGARANYHPAYDRGGATPGGDPWDLQPPDGSITAGDIASAVVQFGHSCA